MGYVVVGMVIGAWVYIDWTHSLWRNGGAIAGVGPLLWSEFFLGLFTACAHIYIPKRS